MSYPWFKFRVTFVDDSTSECIATGITVADAIHELTDYKSMGPTSEWDQDVKRIEWVGMAEGYEWCLPSDWKDRLVPVEETQVPKEGVCEFCGGTYSSGGTGLSDERGWHNYCSEACWQAANP